MKKIKLILVLGAIGCLSACSATKAVKKRAAFDLNCSEDKVVVSDLGSGGWGAVGCEKRTSYYCVGGGLNQVRCSKDSESSIK